MQAQVKCGRGQKQRDILHRPRLWESTVLYALRSAPTPRTVFVYLRFLSSSLVFSLSEEKNYFSIPYHLSFSKRALLWTVHLDRPQAPPLICLSHGLSVFGDSRVRLEAFGKLESELNYSRNRSTQIPGIPSRVRVTLFGLSSGVPSSNGL